MRIKQKNFFVNAGKNNNQKKTKKKPRKSLDFIVKNGQTIGNGV